MDSLGDDGLVDSVFGIIFRKMISEIGRWTLSEFSFGIFVFLSNTFDR